jgi:spoIIIJ-associated protein
MRSVETEGASIDEAIDRALTALRVTRDQVEIEVLEGATRGLFGIGGRPARVRASLRHVLSSVVGGEDAAAEESVSRETTGSERQNRDASAARARQALHRILDHLVDSPCIEEIRDPDQPAIIRFALSGAESGIIIGRRGQTLDALEHLVGRIVSRDDADASFRIALDVEGYRQRRRQALEELARRLGAKARATGRSVTLSPMSPRDRRVVHLALEPEYGITTASEGEGLYRRVVIRPERAARGRRDGGAGSR